MKTGLDESQLARFAALYRSGLTQKEVCAAMGIGSYKAMMAVRTLTTRGEIATRLRGGACAPTGSVTTAMRDLWALPLGRAPLF